MLMVEVQHTRLGWKAVEAIPEYCRRQLYPSSKGEIAMICTLPRKPSIQSREPLEVNRPLVRKPSSLLKYT
jgi:hypothetical protein